MKWSIPLILLLAISCAPKKAEIKSPENVVVNADGSKTLRTFHKNNKLKTEITYRDSVRNGIARTYDEEGNVTMEINYVKDKREGKVTRFYPGGFIHQVTEYVNDVMHGSRVKYRSNGNLISEARYENDYPCLGLKEYKDDKSPRKKYPQLVIKEFDHIAASGEYTLEVSMTDNVKRVKFYTGKLTPSGCLSMTNNSVPLDGGRRVGVIRYRLLPGDFVMDELNIVAVVETLNDNSYVCQKTFNVSIKN